ncbi:zinc finger protein 112-like isoform X3 [Zootermopsis nevadensis]|uniref:zinc finger protein 112-like isoform X3 n=1 Tax=Zootermopsis nevadensis TaxID=136037 RepID=UPI000B8E62D2|nr:zinc finger protein 112-like isoform X3 [Zootermopsis nevadensis]
MNHNLSSHKLCRGELPEPPNAFSSHSDRFLGHMRMYNSDFQMTSLGASRKDNCVVKVECNVDIETQPGQEDHLSGVEQEGVPFSFVAVKQEVEEPWAVTPIKEEQIDEITKEEHGDCLEGDDQLPHEQEVYGGYSTVQLAPHLDHDLKCDADGDFSTKDVNFISQKVIEVHSELSDNGSKMNENAVKNKNTQIVGQTYKCEICGSSFPEKWKLVGHQHMHPREPVKCEICNKSFSHKGALNKHRRLHTEEKRYKCNSCSKCFTKKSHLDRHRLIHTGEKPFKCEICNNSFTQKGSLDTHRRMHSGEKHFKCQICNKYFTRSSYLVVHQRIHTGEKPYTCEFCTMSFRCRGNLVSHIRTHTVE